MRSGRASSGSSGRPGRPIRDPRSGSTWRCRPAPPTTGSSSISPPLGPTGPGNPEPLVGVHGLTVTRVRATAGGHAQLTLRRDVDVVDAIAFDRGDLVDTVHEGDRSTSPGTW